MHKRLSLAQAEREKSEGDLDSANQAIAQLKVTNSYQYDFSRNASGLIAKVNIADNDCNYIAVV